MDHAVLVEDVMYIIMSFADRPTVSRMMQTCRTLSHGGVPYILRDDVELCLTSLDASFLQFILADPLHRYQSLCGLSISPGDFAVKRDIPYGVPEILNGFFLILAAVGENFTRLTLYDAEDILQLHPNLPYGIASLTNLEELRMYSAGSVSCKMLHNLQSSLSFVKVTTLSDDDDPAQDMVPTTIVQGSQTTLWYLSFSNFHTIPDGPRYPNLTVLDIVNTWTFITHHYVHAFPNLTTLYVSESMVTDARDFEDLTILREANLVEQQRHGAWKSLHKYHGPLGILYVLGITCPIARLSLDDTDGHGFDSRMLRTVLSDARPSHLTIMLEDGLDGVSPEMTHIVRDRCAQGLQYLEIEPHVRGRDIQAEEVVELWDAVCSIIDESSIVTTFKLRLQWWHLEPARDTCADSPWSVVLHRIDEAAYADELLAKSKNLKRVELTLSNGRRDGGRTVQRVRD